jgi:hypothetical protein
MGGLTERRWANGHPAGSGDLFCGPCGAPVGDRSVSARYCSNGHEVGPAGTFCSACGLPINGQMGPRTAISYRVAVPGIVRAVQVLLFVQGGLAALLALTELVQASEFSAFTPAVLALVTLGLAVASILAGVLLERRLPNLEYYVLAGGGAMSGLAVTSGVSGK